MGERLAIAALFLVVTASVACSVAHVVRTADVEHPVAAAPAPIDAGPPDAPPPIALVDAGTSSAPPDAMEPLDAARDGATSSDEGDVAVVRRGRRAYAAHCETCHEDGPALRGRHLTAARIRRQVRSGGARMPAIAASTLSDADLDAIVAYLAR